jgi:hypothetical protein
MLLKNILIATGIMWLLSILFVKPLTLHLLKKKLNEPNYAHLRGNDPEELNDDQKKELASLATKCYILADVLVLGIAGFIAGLLGYWFIGISLGAKGWPGVLAFIFASFTGVIIKSNLLSS